jgi:uncharacterized glyoxalase superfamily protein PhnB
MNPDKLVPMISTQDLASFRAFYTEKLGFRVTFDHPCYLGLKAAGSTGPELSFMPPCEGQAAFDGRGLTLSLQVQDVDAEHVRLSQAGVTIVQPPQDNPWGDRSFIALDPLGIALYVSREIEMQSESKGFAPE